MIPPEVERAVYGAMVPPALSIADSRGVTAALIRGGPMPGDRLAAATEVDEDTLTRIVGVLVAAGLVERGAAGPVPIYSVPAHVAPYLDQEHDLYLGSFLGHLLSGTTGRLDRLDHYLDRGKATVDEELPDPFSTFYRDSDAVTAFLEAMWGLSHAVSYQLAELAELAATRTLIDVGGANGPFATAALERHPALHATVFDLPVVEPHVDAVRTRRGLEDRLDFVAGDFFADTLPVADCFAFGYILSDWDDATSQRLLESAHRSCTPGGRVLVMERLFDDDRRGPLSTAVQNLSMHVETQGRHRTGEEYVALLRSAGFTRCEVRRSDADKHLVMGQKA